MVFINKERLKRGIPIGEISKGLPMFHKAEKTEIKANSDIYSSMARKAIPVLQKRQIQTYNQITKEWQTIIPFTLFTEGHGEIIEPNTTNKPGIGTEIKSKTGKADENDYMDV